MRLLAANILNTISIADKLLLTRGRAGRRVDRRIGQHIIYVPSDRGGRLVVGLSAGYPANSAAKFAVLAHGGSVVHKPKDGESFVTIYLDQGDRKAGRHNGGFDVYVKAEQGTYSVYANFVDRGVALERDGNPLIPWNFWYYPFGMHDQQKSAWGGSEKLRPLQKYEKAFGRKGVLKWEIEHHMLPAADVYAGHCHIGALAAIAFRPPPAGGVTHNGVHFTCEELKLLAAEYLGQHFTIDETEWWYLPEWEDRTGPFHEQRPDEAPRVFGPLLVGLLRFLQKYVRDAGRPLMVDVRGDTAAEVWNQAVFSYATELEQIDPDDLELVKTTTTLFANTDVMHEDFSSSGLPATGGIHEGRAYVTPTKTCLKEFLSAQIRFTEAGDFDESSEDTQWNAASLDGQKKLAPCYATLLDAPLKNEGPHGNPRVLPKDVLKLLTLRDGF